MLKSKIKFLFCSDDIRVAKYRPGYRADHGTFPPDGLTVRQSVRQSVHPSVRLSVCTHEWTLVGYFKIPISKQKVETLIGRHVLRRLV